MLANIGGGESKTIWPKTHTASNRLVCENRNLFHDKHNDEVPGNF